MSAFTEARRSRVAAMACVIALAGGGAVGVGCGGRDNGGAVRTDGGDIVPTKSGAATTTPTTGIPESSGTPSTTTKTGAADQPDGSTTTPDPALQPEGPGGTSGK